MGGKKQCPSCNQMMPAGVKFCNQCGYRFPVISTKEEEKKEVPKEETEVKVEVKEEARGKPRRRGMYILLACIGFLVLGAGVYAFSQRKAPAAAEQKETNRPNTASSDTESDDVRRNGPQEEELPSQDPEEVFSEILEKNDQVKLTEQCGSLTYNSRILKFSSPDSGPVLDTFYHFEAYKAQGGLEQKSLERYFSIDEENYTEIFEAFKIEDGIKRVYRWVHEIGPKYDPPFDSTSILHPSDADYDADVRFAVAKEHNTLGRWLQDFIEFNENKYSISSLEDDGVRSLEINYTDEEGRIREGAVCKVYIHLDSASGRIITAGEEICDADSSPLETIVFEDIEYGTLDGLVPDDVARQRFDKDLHGVDVGASGEDRPFYGIWCDASKNYDDAYRFSRKVVTWGFPAEVYVTSDWDNLNPEKWYAVTAGIYDSKEEAESMLSVVKAYYPDAYVKYSGNRRK